jgi:hypothetical protein
MTSILKFQPSVVDVETFELFDRSVNGEETMKILLLAEKLILAH